MFESTISHNNFFKVKVKNISDLTKSRSLAAFVLAAAISRIFPKARFLEGGGTSFGFYYDFILEGISSEQFGFIEETMANLLTEEIRCLHMTGQNAKELFKHYGFSSRANEIDPSSFVDLLQMGNFVDFQKAEVSKDLHSFKLFQIEKINEKTRVYGALFEDLKDLKKFLKSQKKYEGHLELAEDMGLYYPERDIWSFKGVDLKNLLLNFFIKELKKDNFFFIESSNTIKNISFLLEKEKKFLSLPLKIAEVKETSRMSTDFLNPPSGFFSLNNVLTLSEYILCGKDFVLEEVISSLKFFLKILKIFDFSFKVVFCHKAESGKRERKSYSKVLEEGLRSVCDYEVLEGVEGIEIWIEDGRGWYHRGPLLSLEALHEKVLLKRTIGVIEDFIALILEKTCGKLPIWLSPEWVRIVSVNNDCTSFAKTIKEICEKNNIRAYVDASSEALSEKIKSALKARTTFIAIVGEKEKESGRITLRSGEVIEEVRIESLLNKLKMEIV